MRAKNVWEEFVRLILYKLIGNSYLVGHLDGSTDIKIDISDPPELRLRPLTTTFLYIDPSWKIIHNILAISFDILLDTLEKYWQLPNMQEYYYIARLLICFYF